MRCVTVYAVGEEYRISCICTGIGTVCVSESEACSVEVRARAVRVSLAERPYAVRVIVRSFGTFNTPLQLHDRSIRYCCESVASCLVLFFVLGVAVCHPWRLMLCLSKVSTDSLGGRCAPRCVMCRLRWGASFVTLGGKRCGCLQVSTLWEW